MAQTTYIKVLPNLTKVVRDKAYEKLGLLVSHLGPMDINLLSLHVDVPTRTITVVVSGPFTDDELDHFGML